MSRILALTLAALALLLVACGEDSDDAGSGSGGSGDSLTIYSGRNEQLVGELIKRFERETGVKTEVRYGESAELAATLLEEAGNSPADVFFSQDAGALGALQKEDLLAALDPALLRKVPARYRSRQGYWIGASARARVVAYDKRKLEPSDLPKSILDFTDSKWKGKIAWAPTNASFQAFITALRVDRGEAAARRWIEGIEANDVERYENNIAIRDAIANGEIETGFINHYYVAEAIAKEGTDYPVGIYQTPNGDIGSLVNVAGAGILKSTGHSAAAKRFVEFLFTREAQQYFADKTKEYPIAAGVKAEPALIPLKDIQQPDIDLSSIDDLKGTVKLLQDTGAL